MFEFICSTVGNDIADFRKILASGFFGGKIIRHISPRQFGAAVRSSTTERWFRRVPIICAGVMQVLTFFFVASVLTTTAFGESTSDGSTLDRLRKFRKEKRQRSGGTPTSKSSATGDVSKKKQRTVVDDVPPSLPDWYLSLRNAWTLDYLATLVRPRGLELLDSAVAIQRIEEGRLPPNSPHINHSSKEEAGAVFKQVINAALYRLHEKEQSSDDAQTFINVYMGLGLTQNKKTNEMKLLSTVFKKLYVDQLVMHLTDDRLPRPEILSKRRRGRRPDQIPHYGLLVSSSNITDLLVDDRREHADVYLEAHQCLVDAMNYAMKLANHTKRYFLRYNYKLGAYRAMRTVGFEDDPDLLAMEIDSIDFAEPTMNSPSPFANLYKRPFGKEEEFFAPGHPHSPRKTLVLPAMGMRDAEVLVALIMKKGLDAAQSKISKLQPGSVATHQLRIPSILSKKNASDFGPYWEAFQHRFGQLSDMFNLGEWAPDHSFLANEKTVSGDHRINPDGQRHFFARKRGRE